MNTASATLAVSITEPPPTARKESAPASLAAAAQRSHDVGRRVLRHVVEDAGHLEAAVARCPPRTLSTRPVPRITSSVTTKTRLRALLLELEARSTPSRSRPAITRVVEAYW